MTKSEPSGSAKTGAMGLSRTWFGELFKTQIGFALQVGMPNNIPPPPGEGLVCADRNTQMWDCTGMGPRFAPLAQAC